MEITYYPGACNIGAAEIARRRRSATVLALATLVVAVALVASGLPPMARLLVFPLAAAAAVARLQVVRRFCVAFGALGIRNLGALGTAERVAEAEARAADRRTALRLLLEGSLHGLVITAVLVVLPV